MIGSRRHFARASRRRWHGGRGLAVILVAAAVGGALLACASDPHDASSGEQRGTPPSADSAQQTTESNSSSREATEAIVAVLVTDSLIAREGTCLQIERAPARSRLIYSLLPAESSYLRLAVVTSPDGARPVMVDLARGLTGRRILYATLAPGAGLVRLRKFRSASDQHPLVTDVPLGHPAAQHLLLLGERALTLTCRGA
ncbi:MAG TPA: hypothetical protein VJO33_16885 [Gemmatimonadaceae bacterium]|nr:hypothetical protein [Gemmatimonadaceae bacterium]